MKLKVFSVSPIYKNPVVPGLTNFTILVDPSLDIITTCISTRIVRFSGVDYKIFNENEIIHFYNMHDIMDPVFCVIYAQK